MPCPCCCEDCDSPCCGTENPVAPGVCCEGVWRTDDEPGECCGEDGQSGREWCPPGNFCCGTDCIPEGTTGVCCDDQWYTGDGNCCGGQWIAACPEGEAYFEWGDGCCGCYPEESELSGDLGCQCNDIVGYESPEDPYVSCCDAQGNLTTVRASECIAPDTIHAECGECPRNCCTEETAVCDTVSCEEVVPSKCVSPSTLAVDNDCSTGCVGACCEDGVFQGQTTLEDCSGPGQCWGPLGSDDCFTGCRDPFDVDCCIDVVSTQGGESLTFFEPCQRRCPRIADTLTVRVTGETDSPVRIHGTEFGAIGRRCPIDHTFLLCRGEFDITPSQCGTEFINLTVRVCWEEEATDSESLNFSGCNGITIGLGNSLYSCVTTLVYTGSGHTSDVDIVLYGDAVIEASGTGPLVLTSDITVAGSGVTTLTLTGTSTADNEVRVIQNSPSGLSVKKTGPGVWRLNGDSTFSKKLEILEGTVILDRDVGVSGASPFGTATTFTDLPVIGGASTGATLILNDKTVQRGFTVAPGVGVVVLGGLGTAIYASGTTIRLGRDVTLAAGGTTRFANGWADGSGGSSPAVAITVGMAGSAGTVVLESDLPSSITAVNAVVGTMSQDADERIGSGTPVTISSATYNLGGHAQSLVDLSLAGSSAAISNGTLKLGSYPTPSGTATLTATGSGHAVSAAVSLEVPVTFSGAGSFSISGVISGANGITANGTGSVTLSGTNTYSGTTTINSGTMKAGSVSAFGTGGIVVNPGGTLDKNGYAIANSITNNGGTVIP